MQMSSHIYTFKHVKIDLCIDKKKIHLSYNSHSEFDLRQNNVDSSLANNKSLLITFTRVKMAAGKVAFPSGVIHALHS